MPPANKWNNIIQKRKIAFVLISVLWFVFSQPQAAVAASVCQSLDFEGASFTVCRAGPHEFLFELFNLDENGVALGSFDAIVDRLKAQGRDVAFAVNGGMYDEQRKPVGLYIENGKQLKKLNRRATGFGNFHLKPNGVFFVVDGVPHVLETETYMRSGIDPSYATQSGPMLVVDGQIHPGFSPNSQSLKRRNGVGIDQNHQAVFVTSEKSVSFHHLARLFLEELKIPNALFLDGSVSSLYAPELNRNDRFFRLGPIIAVVKK